MAIQNHMAQQTMSRSFTQAKPQVIAKSNPVEQVAIVLDGQREAERIIPAALDQARQHNATLVIVCTASANLYLKTVCNKVKAQYSNVIAY